MIESISKPELFIIHVNKDTNIFQVMEHKLKFQVNAPQGSSELEIIQASNELVFKSI